VLPGQAMTCRAASGRAWLLLDSGALGDNGGAVSSRSPAAIRGQAARSYSWTMPPRMSRRVTVPSMA
jgi:hypothetical protein